MVKDPEEARARLEELGLRSAAPPGPQVLTPEGRQPTWGVARARSPTFEAEPLPEYWD
jgi:hypothetical protein